MATAGKCHFTSPAWTLSRNKCFFASVSLFLGGLHIAGTCGSTGGAMVKSSHAIAWKSIVRREFFILWLFCMAFVVIGLHILKLVAGGKVMQGK